VLDDAQRQKVLALATDFPRMWEDPATPARERKRMARLLIEDVTLLKGDDVVAHVRFRGGAAHTINLPRPKPAADLHKLDPSTVSEVDRLLEDHTEREIADILNSRGLQPPIGDQFTTWVVWKIRKAHGLETRFSRLRRQGLLTVDEMAEALGVHRTTVKKRQERGQLPSIAYNDKNQHLYFPPGPPATAVCSKCGKPVPERNKTGNLRKYCSVTCRTGAYAARRRAAGWVRPRRRR
jgi:DNA-binding XRE family transcriptional regulator